MQIVRVKSDVLKIPLGRPITPPASKDVHRLDCIFALIVHLETDTGLVGLGFAYTLGGGGMAMKVLAEHDLAPLVLQEDPLDHERLGARVYGRLQGIGRTGLVQQAYSAFDLALWDLKGKAAGLPLYKLLGGARESAAVYGSDTAWLWMKPHEVVEASQPYLQQGMMGIKVKVGSPNPETDAERLQYIREALGDDVWLAVDANQKYDYGTALSMGDFFEELSIDWLEEPLSCEDVEGHARLADKLTIPIALGETLFHREEIRGYLERNAVDVVQPDVTRLGGLTAFLRVAALADLHHRPVAPHLLPEVAVHLACGLPQVRIVEYMPWLTPMFMEPPVIVDGKIVPPKLPGLGLEIRSDAVEEFGLKS